MKKALKLTVAIYLMLVLCGTVPVFATDSHTDATVNVVSAAKVKPVDNTFTTYSNSFPYNSLGNALIVSTSWKTLATSTTGFNCNVFISCWNTAVYRCDVRMLGRNGNVLWSESGAIGGRDNRIFKCGSDVYTIQVKTQGGTATVYAYQTNQDPT